MSNTRKRYNDSFKKQIVELHELGKPVMELAEEYGVSAPTIYNWIKLYSVSENTNNGSIALSDHKKALLEKEKEIQRLKLENEILKKATAIFAKED